MMMMKQLKQEKRHGKKTGELFNKLHESYEELLEKYAQAENTIDQLRFQPRIFGINTPTSNSSEVRTSFSSQGFLLLLHFLAYATYHSTTKNEYKYFTIKRSISFNNCFTIFINKTSQFHNNNDNNTS
jgi:hypothetical protein